MREMSIVDLVDWLEHISSMLLNRSDFCGSGIVRFDML